MSNVHDVHFFKPTGKWYTTEHIEIKDSQNIDQALHDALIMRADDGGTRYRYGGMYAFTDTAGVPMMTYVPLDVDGRWSR